MSSPLELALISSEWSRPPLSPVTNSPPQTPTPVQSKRIRRKSSLICRADSSEELISSHESIFHAERFSNSDSESNDVGLFSKITLIPTVRSISSMSLTGNNENIRNRLLSPTVGNTPILYGHGTALSTIVEQKSSTTMSTKVSLTPPESTPEASIAKVSISKILGHRNSFDLPSTVTIRSPRRRRSFSADDLYFIKRSYHDACTVIERESNSTFAICNFYAEARLPILPPIERPPTPPGMPSWTEAQNNPVRSSNQLQRGSAVRTLNSFQRFLGVLSGEVSSGRPVAIALQNSNQSIPATIPSGVPPRFRPIRSGHGMGPLDSHPFHRAAHADAKSDAVPATLRITGPPPSQRAIKTKSGAKTRQRYLPNITGRARMSASTTSRSRNIRRGQDGQCSHRRGRPDSLRGLNQRAVAAIPDLRYETTNVTHPTPREPQETLIQQSATPIAAIEPQSVVTTQSTVVPPRIPNTTDTTAPLSPITSIPTRESTPRSQKCWKCRIVRIFRAIDGFWDEATALLCGLFCSIGVDQSDLGSPSPPGRRVLSLAG